MSLSSGSLDETWAELREELRRSVGELTFHLWLDPLELAACEPHLLYLRAPRHIQTLVEQRYSHLLRAAARRALGRSVAIAIVGDEWVASAHPQRPKASGHSLRGGHRADVLNPKYTFDQFVIGDGNRLAHAAALAVAEQPAQTYNPLFLYGAPGLGKTHLLHAIGNYVHRYAPGMSLRYATSDDFTSHFVRAIRSDGLDAFKVAFREVELLLLDDVQLFANRTRTQEELFHTFNSLYESGCQLVISSDRSPPDMSAFEQRLLERFASGLVARLEAPDLDLRHAILRKRAAIDEVPEIEEEVLREVALRGGSSVRALEGALIRVVAYASLRGERPTPALARHLLEQLYPQALSRRCTLDQIQAATARRFDLTREDLTAHTRRPQATYARQVAMYLARELTTASLPAIGASFGGRNHSTVLHAHRRISDLVDRDEETAGAVVALRGELSPPDPDRAE